jgi:WD40 repeat protein
MDVDYSPTGREFVAGSYDRSVRIYAHNGGHSREVYHTKRMQRVFAVRFSGDASYVFSGSDDMNLRVWKVRLSSDLAMPEGEREKRCMTMGRVYAYGCEKGLPPPCSLFLHS